MLTKISATNLNFRHVRINKKTLKTKEQPYLKQNSTPSSFFLLFVKLLFANLGFDC